MAKVAVTESYLEDIADAIRAKTGLSNTYTPAQMATAISAIPSSGGITPTGTINIASNDTYDVTIYANANVNVPGTNIVQLNVTSNGTYTASSGSAYSPVVVNVSGGGSVNNQDKSVDPTESAQDVTFDSGYTGLGTVTVNAISSSYIGSAVPQRTSSNLSISGNTVTALSGYYAANASKSIPNGTASTPATTITANPSITVNTTTGLITATASKTQNVTPSVSAGYISSGTAGTITVSGTNTSQLTTVSGTTINPTESVQTAVAANRYTLGAVSVGAISSTYVGSGITQRTSANLSASGNTVTAPAGYYAAQATKSIANGNVTAPSTISGTSASVSTGTNTLTLSKTVSVTPSVSTAGYISSGTAGNSNVSLTASVTTKAAATFNTSSSDQTIASGTYLTGTQTIKAVTVSGLASNKVLSGTTVNIGDANDADRIASVSGSVTFQTYYTGSSTPSSTLGVNGDIYLKTS